MKKSNIVATKDQLRRMYENMVKARYYEDTIAAIYMEGKTPAFAGRICALSFIPA